MYSYLSILRELVEKHDKGSFKKDRTGTGTVSSFGAQLRFDLGNGQVPLLTTKKLHLKSIIHELIWFFQGSENIGYLREHGIRIWDEWADSEGNLGPVYPVMWRQWPDFKENSSVDSLPGLGYTYSVKSNKIDQLQNVIEGIRLNPESRRHIVSAWNPALLEKQALPPCHTLFQFNCEEISHLDRIKILDTITNFSSYPEDSRYFRWLEEYKIPKYYLDCQLYQRSADWFLGVPFNIASYSILTHIIGKLTNTLPREFIHTFGDYHLYLNHIEQAKEQLARKPMTHIKPFVLLNSQNWNNSIDKVTYEDIIIIDYDAYPNIKAPVAV